MAASEEQSEPPCPSYTAKKAFDGGIGEEGVGEEPREAGADASSRILSLRREARDRSSLRSYRTAYRSSLACASRQGRWQRWSAE